MRVLEHRAEKDLGQTLTFLYTSMWYVDTGGTEGERRYWERVWKYFAYGISGIAFLRAFVKLNNFAVALGYWAGGCGM